ncbi:MAG: sulfite exporter TauE/SafE family protein [Longimicrobiales bacterium]
MELLPIYLSALVLGTAHALEPDHLAAVTAFVVRRPRPLHAAGFGARWAIGHGAAIFAVGVLLLIAGRSIPDGWTSLLDRVVGLAMIGLGVWTLVTAKTVHAHSHTHTDGTTHTHPHAHARGGEHGHAHAATGFGLLHGLAGTGPAVALIPLLSLRSPREGAVYLFLFGVGTAVGMTAYALLAGVLAARLARGSGTFSKTVSTVAGLFAMLVGFIWLLR